jgi:hypothetical protein
MSEQKPSSLDEQKKSRPKIEICRNGNRQHFWFHDPDEKTLNAIKTLLELEKEARKN